MIQLGDLPHVYRGGREETFGLCPADTVLMTVHTVELNHPRNCHCCGRRVQTVVIKPGSPYLWCLSCFGEPADG